MKKLKIRYEIRKGFTLAEVLITLGIIGVVAAMTLPAVVNKYQEKVTVNKVKKFYSVINQALLFAIKDNGYVDEWAIPPKLDADNKATSDVLAGYLKPYLKISKDCGGNSTCIPSLVYKRFNGAQQVNYGASSWYYKMILADGSYMWLRSSDGGTGKCDSVDGGYSNTCGAIWFDINGGKPPNTVGKDTFVFVILNNRVAPVRENDCKSGGSGWGCSSYILQHGDMKYLYK